jgi:hypothetical protein
MKRFLLIAVCLILVVGIASAQRYNSTSVYYRLTANSVTDTVGGTLTAPAYFSLGTYAFSSLYLTSTDSARVYVYVDAAPRGTTTWATVVTDSLVATGSGTSKEVLMRGTASDLIGKVSSIYRVRVAFQSYGNSVNSGGGFWAAFHTR